MLELFSQLAGLPVFPNTTLLSHSTCYFSQPHIAPSTRAFINYESHEIEPIQFLEQKKNATETNQ